MRKIAFACATIGCIVAAVPGSALGFETIHNSNALNASDPTYTGRVLQSGTASTCDTNKPFPGPMGLSATHDYETFNGVNAGTTPACIQVHLVPACGAGTNISSAGYADAFLPSSLQTNYLGDAGTSSGGTTTALDYAFLAPPGPFEVLVYELTSGTGCASFSLRLRISPSADTAAASDVGKTSVTLNGSASPEGETVSGQFEFGPPPAFGMSTPLAPIPGTLQPSLPFSALVSGLAPDTTYHYRSVISFPAVGSSPAGTAKGPEQTFPTPGDPTAVTQAATEVDSTSATLNGTVAPHGLDTIASFEYGTTTAYGSSATTPASQDVGADHNGHALHLAVAGLEPSTTYHYRVVAKQGSTTVTGADQTFTTADGPQPPPAPPAASSGGSGGGSSTSNASGGSNDSSSNNGGAGSTSTVVTTPPPVPLVTLADTVAPRFLRAPKVTVRHRRATFAYTLPEPAAVTIALRRTVARTARRRVVRAGTLHQAGRAGRNTLQRRLQRGAYTLTATARDAAGNVSSSRRARFRVR